MLRIRSPKESCYGHLKVAFWGGATEWLIEQGAFGTPKMMT
jgi:hypothetical protein